MGYLEATLIAVLALCACTDARSLSAVPGTPIQEPVAVAEEFESRESFDLEGWTVKFDPFDLSYCLSGKDASNELPVSPFGGEVLFRDSYYYSEEIRFSDGFRFPFLGNEKAAAFVNRRGFITFDEADDRGAGSLSRHWEAPRVSVLMANLNLQEESVVSWKQLSDRVVVTWSRTEDSDFQVALLSDGRVEFSYERVGYTGHKVVGISGGIAGSVADLSSSPACAADEAPEEPSDVVKDRGYGQLFTDGYDLEYAQLEFSAPDYELCTTRNVDSFPVDPSGGSALLFRHSYDSAAEIRFSGGFRFPFDGVAYSSVYLNFNGFLTFDEMDTEVKPTMRSHFARPRVSVLYSRVTLDPSEALISWKQLPDRLVITFEDVAGSDYQVSLHESGRISFTYLELSRDTRDIVVGVSLGVLGSVSDLSMAGSCDGEAPVQVEAAAPVAGETEAFHDGFDMEYSSVTFSAPHYKACATYGVDSFPVDPTGGTVLPFRYSYDYVQEVRFGRGFRFPFPGGVYTSAYVSYKGFLTFDEPVEDWFPSLRSHFLRPRLSVYYSDLKLDDQTTMITWKQLRDRFTVTFQGVSESNFQVSLHADGTISYTYLGMSRERGTKVVGVSMGMTGPLADLSSKYMCDAPDLWPEQGAGAPDELGPGSAEIFLDGMDLQFSTLKYSAPSYQPCASWGVQELPVDPRGSEVLPFRYRYDSHHHIRFSNGFRFPFAGNAYTSAYVSRKGFVTFDAADDDINPSLRSHFLRPRLSAMYSNLDMPDGEGVVSWKQIGTEGVVVTFERVSGSTFQIGLLRDGTVTFTYLDVPESLSSAKVVGVSVGLSGTVMDISSSAAMCDMMDDGSLSSPKVEVSGVAQAFDDDAFDLEHTSLFFSPKDFSVCTAVDIESLPVDPEGDGATALMLDRYDRTGPVAINFERGFKFPFMGEHHSSVFVSGAGYISFGADAGSVHPALRSHFSAARISPLYGSLKPSRDEMETAISWRQLGDKAAVTWHLEDDTDFQAILHEDGSIEMAYLKIGSQGLPAVVGVSLGENGDVTDMSAQKSCSVRERSIRMECPQGHNLTSSNGPGAFGVMCTDGSSIQCEISARDNRTECTLRSKLI